MQEKDNADADRTVRLFKISGVAIATLLGSVLAGGIILGINFLKMKEPVKARKTFIFSFLAFIAIIILLPSIRIHYSIEIVFQLVIMVQIAKQHQESRIREHVRKGGKLASNWLACAISILVTAPMIVPFLY